MYKKINAFHFRHDKATSRLCPFCLVFFEAVEIMITKTNLENSLQQTHGYFSTPKTSETEQSHTCSKAFFVLFSLVFVEFKRK